MENNLVIGILNIVEDKLREYGIQLPADEREDSTDPIVGYDYAELHDRILEYLQEQDLIRDNDVIIQPASEKVFAVSIVNSEGFADGNDSQVKVFSNLPECIDQMYRLYAEYWLELLESEVIEDRASFLTKSEFEKELIENKSLCIQCYDAHVNFEFFEQEIGSNRAHTGISDHAADVFWAVKDISNDIKCQLIHKTNTTSYGEPQAFAELSTGRSIEVTLEQEGLDESEYFFSVRLHSNAAEYDSGYFHSTCGIIDQYSSSGCSYHEIDDLIKKALASHEKHPVPDACMPQPDWDEKETSKAPLSEQISSAFSRVNESLSSGERGGINPFNR